MYEKTALDLYTLSLQDQDRIFTQARVKLHSDGMTKKSVGNLIRDVMTKENILRGPERTIADLSLEPESTPGALISCNSNLLMPIVDQNAIKGSVEANDTEVISPVYEVEHILSKILDKLVIAAKERDLSGYAVIEMVCKRFNSVV